MKKITVALVALMSLTAAAQAQTPLHEPEGNARLQARGHAPVRFSRGDVDVAVDDHGS